MAEFTYYIMQDNKVFNPKTGETEEVKAGDEVPHADLWQNRDALLNTGVLMRVPKDAPAPDVAAEPVVAEDEVEELVEEVVEETPEEERFDCPFCDKSYETEGWLDRHVTDKHVESDEDE